MTPAEAKAQVMDLYQAMMSLVGVDGWDAEGSWTDCDTSGSQELVQWNFGSGRYQALPGAPEDLIKKARAIWNDRGFDVRVQMDTNLTPTRYLIADPPYLTGSNKDGSFYQFAVGTSLADFRGVSACVPGNIGKLNS